MVSFTDHYNAIFNDRFPLKTKIVKDSWHFNNSLLCKPEFCLTIKTFLLFIKNTKNKHTLVSDWWKNTKSSFKEGARAFLKIKENVRNSILKRRLRKVNKKENFKPKLNQWLKNYKMKFIN